MKVAEKTKRNIFLVYFLLVPAGMILTYQAFPPAFSGQWLDLLAFLLLIAVVASMPITINYMHIFLIQWVSLAAFLKFGLFIEMVLAQIAVVILLFKLRIQKSEFFRLPLNMTMFFFVSLLSGVFYYELGGHTGPSFVTEPRSIWLAALYAVAGYFLNQVIVSFNLRFVYKRRENYFGKDFFVETVTTLITLPLGFFLYMFYNQVGVMALFFVGLPFISISLVFHLYYSSEKVNLYLQKAADISHEMAQRLRVDDVTDLFFEKIGEMLPVDYAYIFEPVNEQELEMVRRLDQSGPDMIPRMKKHEGINGYVWAQEKAICYSSKKEWLPFTKGFLPEDAESILAVPIIRNKKVVGVLTLASRQKRAYKKSQLMIVDILCSSFAVAVENAKNYEQTKIHSERCALTNLYNFRYFDHLLHEEFVKLTRFERTSLSLILLDIDHFKIVNDTYGHPSGNEILIELANRLRKLVGSQGTVARFGGEEFVVLLPDAGKQTAGKMAEMIRESIANWPFNLQQSIEPGKKQSIQITASIGVATAPDDAEDAMALIRHADRALYVGAKRAGRNRVAEYVK
ncbi:sensor domain-containing diguanylate cyclase [Bacillus sp. FJAT-27251]|uniref:sensor domain-containing diguanylate cyclase n=1 Tax=Bacillus sp. FJAT-27251 TaxID=1684142 RepID=UPI000B16E967|nr:sensor domain-containing diguanylate cyclase [Bacillus sp. FJAT-27251]